MNIEFQLILLGICVVLSAFFSGSEIAIFSSNKIRIKKLAEDGNKHAKTVEWLLEHPNKIIATILIGNNLVNILATVICTSLAIHFFGNAGIGIATAIMTIVILIFGEVTPKALAAQNAEKIALLIASPLLFLSRVFHPLVRVLTGITNFIIALLGGKGKKDTPFITEDELRMLIDVGAKEGTIEKKDKEMLQGVFEFGDKTAKDVMQPRIDMDSIEINASLDEALKAMLKTRHSRLPVYEGSIDNIIGILNLKGLLHQIKEHKQNQAKELSLRESITPVYIVPTSKKLDSLLKEMQKERIHMAIVVDEYGGTAGLLTMEDLLEEIVGDILDESDLVETNIQIVDDKTVLVESKTSIEEVNEALNLSLPEHDLKTIGGLVFNLLGKIPVPGDKGEIGGVTLIVESMRGKRISKVKIVK